MRGQISLASSILSSLLLGSSLASAAVELPVIAWDPGIPGGIPEITEPVASVMEYGAIADGVTDDLAAFQAALAALPDGGVLFVPAGDYFLNATLEIGTDGIVLRGEGADRSRLLLGNATTASISVITYGRGEWQILTEAVARGATTVTVPDGSAFTVGEWAEIQKVNDAALMYTDPAWDVDWAYDCRGQVLEVTAIDGRQLTFRHPLYLDYPLADAPQIRSQHFVKYVGIEQLYLERVTNDSDVGTIQWKNAAYVWMREVESNQTRKAHIGTETVIGCQIENNYFHHAYDYGGGGHGYGTSLGFHTTDCLVENNVFRSLRHAMIIQSGASGNVFGYNHSDEVVQSEGSVPNEGWLPPDISVHGHWSNNNLFESNTVEQVGIADYWGPTGPHVAYLRNRVVNNDLRSDGSGEAEAIALDDHSNYQYLLGNVVEIGTLQDDGTPDMTTNVIHGHVEGSATMWEADIADHEIPASYYWGCKPNFLGDKAWPLVGPDVTPSVDLPAGDRFASGAFTAPSYERGCDDGSTNPGAGGGITGRGGGTAGSEPTFAGGAGPAASSTDEGSGCGCRAAGPGPVGAWALASLALVGLLLRRWTIRPHTDERSGPVQLPGYQASLLSKLPSGSR
jgi:MYXO-CTERM domain-containing protein